MSNKILLFFALLLGAVISIESCKPKNSDNIKPADSTSVDSTLGSPCLVLSESINNVLYKTYEYDSLRRLTRMVVYSGTATSNQIIKRYTFDYNAAGGLLSEFHETSIAQKDQSYIYDLDYGTDKYISAIRKSKVYNSGPRVVDTLKVTYDTDKHITGLVSSVGNTQSWQYYSSGNAKNWLVRIPKTTRDSVMALYNTYDSKTNLYAFSKGIQLVDLLNGKAPSRHNLLSYQIGNTKYDATYTYNTNKVPIQSVVKMKAGKDTVGRETVYTYTLKCK